MKVIKIGATWCSGCIIMRPRWDKIEKIRDIKTEYYDFDIYEDMLKEKYQIGDKLPIFIFLDENNKEFKRLIGEPSEEEILNVIDEYEAKKWKRFTK